MLNRLIKLPNTDSLVLCSGYIWEPEQGYKILDDELLDTIKIGCHGHGITTVAGKLENVWLEYYKNFIRRLRNNGILVKPFFAPKRNWHAKIAIRLLKDTPVAAIVGSSNLTGPAYGENRENWNFEGDVLIWKSSQKRNSYFSKPFDSDLLFGDMQLVLDRRVSQPDEQQQLKSIYEDIFKSDLKELKDE